MLEHFGAVRGSCWVAVLREQGLTGERGTPCCWELLSVPGLLQGHWQPWGVGSCGVRM